MVIVLSLWVISGEVSSSYKNLFSSIVYFHGTYTYVATVLKGLTPLMPYHFTGGLMRHCLFVVHKWLFVFTPLILLLSCTVYQISVLLGHM